MLTAPKIEAENVGLHSSDNTREISPTIKKRLLAAEALSPKEELESCLLGGSKPRSAGDPKMSRDRLLIVSLRPRRGGR